MSWLGTVADVVVPEPPCGSSTGKFAVRRSLEPRNWKLPWANLVGHCLQGKQTTVDLTVCTGELYDMLIVSQEKNKIFLPLVHGI